MTSDGSGLRTLTKQILFQDEWFLQTGPLASISWNVDMLSRLDSFLVFPHFLFSSFLLAHIPHLIGCTDL